MRRRDRILPLVLPIAASLSPPVAHASPPDVTAPMTVVGEVVATQARWTADGSRIVTEATIRTDTGEVVVSQLGGTVDGIGMRTFPGPTPLVTGMTVSVAAHPALDLGRRRHIVVDDVHVTAVPAGFVRTGPTQAGHFLFWESGCVFVTPDAAGTNEVVGDTERAAISDAIAEWNTQVAGCSYMHIVENEPAAKEVGRDDVNLIKFRDTSWCRPAIGDDPARCYSPSAAGITTATFVDDGSSSRDGAIVDADIELNGADFAIANNGQTTGTKSCQSEIRNTLTHELGHLLGLEHPCLAAGDPDRIDGAGNPVPACSATSDPKIVEATMYNFQDCGETKKESLEADDVDAICSVYPVADDPGVCEPVGSGGGGCCSTGPSRSVPASTALLALATLVSIGSRRRKNRFAP